MKKLDDTARHLTTARKQKGKNLPEGLATVDDVKEYSQIAVHTGIHSTGTPGITALDLQVTDDDDLTALLGVLHFCSNLTPILDVDRKSSEYPIPIYLFIFSGC